MLVGRYVRQSIYVGLLFGLTGLLLHPTTAIAQDATPTQTNNWQFRPHIGLDLSYGSLGEGDTALDEEGEFDTAFGYGARLGAKLGRLGLEGRAWYSEPDADFPVFAGINFVDQFPASTDVELLSVHGSFDVYLGERFDVYVSGGYGEGTLEFEFDDGTITEFSDGEVDIVAWFGEIGAPFEIVDHLQVVPYAQFVAWELQEDGDQIDGTERLIGYFAGVTVRGIW